jgi:hypothetical protein
LIEHWDGHRWSIKKNPRLGKDVQVFLNAVTCVRADRCYLVGQYANASTEGVLVERWNGRRWSVMPHVPNSRIPTSPGGYPASYWPYLSDVSCNSTSYCVAVGNDIFGQRQLVEHWNGRRWSVISSPDNFDPFAVACTYGHGCIATGAMNKRPALESIRATRTRVSRSSGAASRAFGDLTCPSATSCFAVAGHSIGHWNGRKWSLMHHPAVAGALSRVSCSSATSCLVLGGPTTHAEGGSTLKYG